MLHPVCLKNTMAFYLAFFDAHRAYHFILIYRMLNKDI